MHTSPVTAGKKSISAGNRKPSTFATVGKSFGRFFQFVVYSALAYFTVAFFNIQLKPDFTLDSAVAFTSQMFHRVLRQVLECTIYLGAISLLMTIFVALYRSFFSTNGILRKAWATLSSLLFASIALWIFCISIVPHTVVDQEVHGVIWPVLRRWHGGTEKYNLVNSYGLFRRMTGVGGRPEIVIEGSDSLTDGWKEYHFLYKPGDLGSRPPIVVPHQPRLDWQMWFAALGTYQQNPWFVSLVHSLLKGQKEVLDLLDRSRNPYPSSPPKYVRVMKYTYHFTDNEDKKRSDWWKRKKNGEYMSALTKDHPSLLEYLKNQGMTEEKPVKQWRKNIKLTNALTITRHWLCQTDAPTLLWSLFFASVVIHALSPFGKDRKSN